MADKSPNASQQQFVAGGTCLSPIL